MNVQQIKSVIGTQNCISCIALTMVRQLDTDNTTPTVWLSHWDNDNRIRVTMHEEVFNLIKSNKDYDLLSFKKEVVAAHKDATTGKVVAAYTRYVVITPRNVEASF